MPATRRKALKKQKVQMMNGEEPDFVFDESGLPKDVVMAYEWMMEGAHKTLYAMNEMGMFNPKLTTEVLKDSAIKICGLHSKQINIILPKEYKTNEKVIINRLSSVVDE